MTPLQIECLLARLEGRGCDCPLIFRTDCDCAGECDCPRVLQRCEHIEEADHDVTFEDWLTFLSRVNRDDYDDPPLPPAAAIALTRQDILALYEERAAAGVALFHPGDSWSRANVDADLQVGVVSTRDETNEETGQVETTVARLRNGRPNPVQTLRGGERRAA